MTVTRQSRDLPAISLTGTRPLSVSKGSQTEAQMNTRNSATRYVMSTQCGILLMCHVTCFRIEMILAGYTNAKMSQADDNFFQTNLTLRMK